MNQVKITSLNVLYSRNIDEYNPCHFNERWPHIQKEMKSGVLAGDVMNFQEVNGSFLSKFRDFADAHDCVMLVLMYHPKRDDHLVTLVKSDIYLDHSFHMKDKSRFKFLSVNVKTPDDGEATIANVHLPFAVVDGKSRLEATSFVCRIIKNMPSVVMIGDYNTLPDVRGPEQLAIIKDMLGYTASNFSVVDSEGNQVDEDQDTTFWGFPHEKKEFQGFNNPLKPHLDHFTTNIKHIVSSTCHQLFIQNRDNETIAISDHFPCQVTFEFPN